MLESSQVADDGCSTAPNTSVPTGEPPFLINGVRRPRLVMRSGEVQNWHFVNTAIFKFLNLSLDGHPLNLQPQQGNTLSQLKPVHSRRPGKRSSRKGSCLRRQIAPASGKGRRRITCCAR